MTRFFTCLFTIYIVSALLKDEDVENITYYKRMEELTEKNIKEVAQAKHESHKLTIYAGMTLLTVCILILFSHRKMVKEIKAIGQRIKAARELSIVDPEKGTQVTYAAESVSN